MTQPEGSDASFEAHVKPLFRSRDRTAMISSFDLWDAASVRANGDAILETVSEGTMPCDGAWTDEQVAVLRGWLEADRSG